MSQFNVAATDPRNISSGVSMAGQRRPDRTRLVTAAWLSTILCHVERVKRHEEVAIGWSVRDGYTILIIPSPSSDVASASRLVGGVAVHFT